MSSFELDIPKALIIALQVNEGIKSRLLIGLAVPMDCLGLKLMAPYNTGKVRSLLGVDLRINGLDEPHRLLVARSRFKAQSGSFNGWSTYQGDAGDDLYVAPSTEQHPIMAFCDNNPQVNGPDTPNICDAETDEATGTDSEGKPEVLTTHYTLLRKDLPDISEIDQRVRRLVSGMLTNNK